MVSATSIRKHLYALYGRINHQFLILALIHFSITLYTDTFIFIYDSWRRFIVVYIMVKLMVLAFLVLFWQSCCFFYSGIKSKKCGYDLFLKCFCTYFGIMLFFLFLAWPGAWYWDDLHVLNSARRLYPLFWQHWLTGLFHIFSLAIFPFPGGIVLMQIFVISLILGYISFLIGKTFSTKLKYILYIPMLFPTVIYYNMLPLRLPLYSYLELLLFSLILFKWYRKSSISIYDTLFWGMLTAVLATWRSEGIAYIVIIPIIIVASFKKHLTFKAVLCFAASMLVLFGSIATIQHLGERGSRNYHLTAILSPLSAILKTDFNSDDPESDIEIINRVINVDLLRQEDGISVFWEEGTRTYTAEEFRALQKVYAKLVMRNIPAYISNQIQWFRRTSSFILLDTKPHIGSTLYLFDVTDDSYYVYHMFRDEFILNRPISEPLRAAVVKFLECRGQNEPAKYNFFRGVFYNLVFPIVIIMIIFVYAAYRKKWPIAFISFAVMFKTCLIFATAPASFFMYYLPTYICGYGLGVIVLLMVRYGEAEGIH